MATLAAEQKWPVGWAYDGRANLFAPKMGFLDQAESTFKVSGLNVFQVLTGPGQLSVPDINDRLLD